MTAEPRPTKAALRSPGWFRRVLRPTLLANHYPPLHGLRVFGILSVIQIHLASVASAHGLLSLTDPVFVISQRIWFGMDLFFFLSGFLIGNLLLVAEAGDGSRGILRFYVRRTFRIVPLYYVVLTALALAEPRNSTHLGQLGREYLYLTNYSDTSHTVMFWGWSLSAEEHFYLAVPILLVLVSYLRSDRARITALTFLWLSGAGVRAAILFNQRVPFDLFHYFQAMYIPTHTRYDILVAGVLLAYVFRAHGDTLREWMSRGAVQTGSLMLTAALLAALMTKLPYSSFGLWCVLSTGTVTGLLYANLTLYLLTVDGVLARFLGARTFLWLATLGYGVYLVHYPIVTSAGLAGYFFTTAKLVPSPAIALVVGTLIVFGLSLGIAYLLHLLVEKPALLARDALTSRNRARPPAGAASPAA